MNFHSHLWKTYVWNEVDLFKITSISNKLAKDFNSISKLVTTLLILYLKKIKENLLITFIKIFACTVSYVKKNLKFNYLLSSNKFFEYNLINLSKIYFYCIFIYQVTVLDW